MEALEKIIDYIGALDGNGHGLLFFIAFAYGLDAAAPAVQSLFAAAGVPTEQMESVCTHFRIRMAEQAMFNGLDIVKTVENAKREAKKKF
jgi:hypothetical protein